MPLDLISLGTHLQAELEMHDPNFYAVPEDEFWTIAPIEDRGTFLPSVGDLPLGVEEVTSYRRSTIGEAAVYDGRSYDIPLVDFGVGKTTVKAVLVIAGAEWSLADVSRNQLNATAKLTPQYNLVNVKMDTVSEALNRRIHRLNLVGMPSIDMGGLLNSTQIDSLDETSETPFQMTPTELYNWMLGLITDFKTSSKLPYNRISAVVSDNLYRYICAPINDNSGDSTFVRLTNPQRGTFLREIISISELTNAELIKLGVYDTGVQKEKIILGDFDRRSLVRHFTPIDRTDPFPKDTGFHLGVTGWAATSELAFNVPERFEYIEYSSAVA